MKHLLDRFTIMLAGRTGSGKTTQLGVLAEYIYKHFKLRTRLYITDPGGIGSIAPHVELGLIEPIYIEDENPWKFLHWAARGGVRDSSATSGWKVHHDPKIGVYGFEGGSATGEAMLADLANQAAEGNNVAGEKTIQFQREGIKVGGNNRSHYLSVQRRIYQEMLQSFKLPGKVIIWTTRISKDEDPTQLSKIVGPEIAGKAMTPDVPAWFNLSLRIDVDAAKGNIPEKHKLYIGTHQDNKVANATALGNPRLPLDGQLKKTIIEPADLAVALDAILGTQAPAKLAVMKRLGLKGRVA